MLSLGLGEIAAALEGTLAGPDVPVAGVAIDTRALAPGALFVALAGARTDGHRFLPEAAARGAAGALVEQPVADPPLPLVRVADTRAALGRLAALWRARFSLPVVGVTGSNGKTTVKEMLGAVLGGAGTVLVTRGNLNNELGLPLTLAGLGPEHDFAVLEMGANHLGEIAGLCRIARPTVGVVTQCAPAHLEGFGSIEGVARAKGEMFAGLADDGVAVINADDAYAGLWQGLAAARPRLTFGLEAPADVTAAWEPRAWGSHVELRTPAGSRPVELPLPGRHNVMNALAATAVALALELPLERAAAGLARAPSVAGRLRRCPGPGGSVVIDDSYNANPASLRAALELLARHGGRRWVALGDMAELGAEGPARHREAGAAARELGIEHLLGVGPLAREAVDGFGPGAEHYGDRAALAAALAPRLGADDVVLVKGSRSAGMERVVAALAGEDAQCS